MRCGSTTESAKLAATAASKAFPPARIASDPASEARGCSVAMEHSLETSTLSDKERTATIARPVIKSAFGGIEIISAISAGQAT